MTISSYVFYKYFLSRINWNEKFALRFSSFKNIFNQDLKLQTYFDPTSVAGPETHLTYYLAIHPLPRSFKIFLSTKTSFLSICENQSEKALDHYYQVAESLPLSFICIHTVPQLTYSYYAIEPDYSITLYVQSSKMLKTIAYFENFWEPL